VHKGVNKSVSDTDALVQKNVLLRSMCLVP